MLKSIFKWRASQKHPVAICAIAKNEGPYLKEWVEFHLKTGVTRFFIYDNDSETPIAEILHEYVQKGVVHVEVVKGKQKQRHAYKHCLANFGRSCQWIAFIDVDEYIVPRTLSGNLPEFLKAYEKFGGLGINWLVFGSNGHISKPVESQMLSYRKRFLKTAVINSHIKSIVQPRYVKSASADPHHFIFRRGKHCVNENFHRITGSRTPNSTNKIQLNHYFLRSLKEFEEKIERGRADGGQTRSMEDFQIWDKEANDIHDESILELVLIMDKKAAGQGLTKADLHP